MQHEADTEHRWSAARWIGIALAGVLTLLVLYVLSVGSVAAIVLRFGLQNGWVNDWLTVFYLPLMYLAEQSDTVAHVFEWYLGLWGVP